MPSIDRSELGTSLLCWFDSHQRDLPWRKTTDPYHIWVSEVMLQQTQVSTVIPYYNRFIKRFPSVDRLAAASTTEVLKEWEGLGYYSRARNLRKAAAVVVSEHGSRVPETYRSFHKLSGVGDYIAAAVQSIAFNTPYAAVDGNVKRVLSRLFELEQPVNEQKYHSDFQSLAETLLDHQRPGDFNQSMMELGATVCKPASPSCESCPINSFCRSLKNGTVGRFPRRLKRKSVPVYHIAVGVILKKEKMLVTLREPKGLLGGLWEFPGGKTEPGESTAKACIREIKEETGLAVQVEQSLGIIRHAYTHFKIVMEVFACRHLSGRVRLNGPVDHRWITFRQIDHYPFPRANHKIFPKLEKYLQENRPA